MADVRVDMAALEREIRPQVDRELERAAEAGAEDARRRVPVDTGRLRDSIKVARTANGARYGSDVDYALFVEFGTVDTPAQPFLRPGLDDVAKALKG